MKMRGPNNSYLFIYQIIIEPDFPSLADEIAKPHPYMNIKVAAFTVREKSINTLTAKCSTTLAIGVYSCIIIANAETYFHKGQNLTSVTVLCL